MAKGRSHRRSRDDYYVANRRPALRPSWLSRPLLDPVHDLRVYHPYRQLMDPVEVRSRPGRLGTAFSSWETRSVPARVDMIEGGRAVSFRTNRFGDVVRVVNRQRAIPVFQEPKRVPICVKRSSRKEVLFAKGKVGRGYKKPRWNERSYMRCK